MLGPGSPVHDRQFLISDPPLKQVISRTYEAGLRGNLGTDAKTGRLGWGLGVFRIGTRDDIINVASALVPMFGYFQNAAKTRRQGIEAKVNYDLDRWHAYANYTFIDATYQTAMVLQSPNNRSRTPPATSRSFPEIISPACRRSALRPGPNTPSLTPGRSAPIST